MATDKAPVDAVMASLVRKVYPKLMAMDLVSVQPMQMSRWKNFRIFKLNKWLRKLGFKVLYLDIRIQNPHDRREHVLTPEQYANNLDAVLRAMFRAKVEVHPVIDNHGMLRLYNAVRWVQVNADRVTLVHDFFYGWRWLWFNPDSNQWLKSSGAATALGAVIEAMDYDVQRKRFSLEGWGNQS
jgi:major capsid protein Gp23